MKFSENAGMPVFPALGGKTELPGMVSSTFGANSRGSLWVRNLGQRPRAQQSSACAPPPRPPHGLLQQKSDLNPPPLDPTHAWASPALESPTSQVSHSAG
eukprot:5896655-Alexandrium_andersonii.AAC.1